MAGVTLGLHGAYIRDKGSGVADVTLTIQRLSPDEAYDRVVGWLRQKVAPPTRHPRPASIDFRLSEVVDVLFKGAQSRWAAANPGQGMTLYRRDPNADTSSLHDVAWQLVRRGVMTPVPRRGRSGDDSALEDAFHITPYGMRWLLNHPDDVVAPTDESRFAAILQRHAARFGHLYEARALEAHGCYQSQLYLGCCAMTGAAAEAIVAAVLVARVGVEKAKALLAGAGWRKKSLDALKHGATAGHAARLDSFLDLLNRWRDSAVHNHESSPTEEEAFMSLLLLLRFVLFANEHWHALTAPPTQ